MRTRLHLLALTPLGPSHTAALENAGFDLTYAGSLGDGVRKVLAGPPDVTLALVPPDAVLTVCEVFRALGPQLLAIAAAGLPLEVATWCLDQGADAVIALPVQPDELVARLQAVCRRGAGWHGDRPISA